MRLLTEKEAQRYVNENINDEDVVIDVETARKIIKDAVLPLLKNELCNKTISSNQN